MSNKITIGSRGSKLAMIQSVFVANKIMEVNPGIDVEITRVVTSGDTNHHIPLAQQTGVGIFVKELEEALLDGRIDLAIHSLKDMPTELPEGLRLAATPERVNPADILISRGKKLKYLSTGSKIGTGSLRRAAQLTHYRPDFKIVSIRGNVDTRINKVTTGDVDAVVLAAAAMKRLGWEDKITEYLPTEHFLPAIGQGALAIETCSEEITRIVAPLNHLPTMQCITAERVFLRTLGGGCQAPIAALATVHGARLKLKGMIANTHSSEMLTGTEEGSATAPEELGIALAEKLLAAGADKFLAE
ncbi:hydroxymethylbilane synthase [Chloroflexota bacterium]